MNSQLPHSATVVRHARANHGQERAPWMTMVHGASHNRRYFSSQVQAFQRDFRLLLVDLPGHGDSADLPGPFGFEEHAAGVLAAMDAVGVQTSHYLGTHTGAIAGLILATRHPHRFSSMVLESPPLPEWDQPSIDEAIARARATARDRGVAAARAEWYERSPWFDVIRNEPERCRADAHWTMLSEFTGKPWLDTAAAQAVAPLVRHLPTIACPVLIVNGEHDVDDFVAAADEIERHLPDVRRVRIAGGGGFPMWEDPQQVNDHIRQHFDMR